MTTKQQVVVNNWIPPAVRTTMDTNIVFLFIHYTPKGQQVPVDSGSCMESSFSRLFSNFFSIFSFGGLRYGIPRLSPRKINRIPTITTRPGISLLIYLRMLTLRILPAMAMVSNIGMVPKPNMIMYNEPSKTSPIPIISFDPHSCLLHLSF